MGFYLTSPWFAAGLIAAAFPVILLFTRAATREKVVFSSVYFLKSVTIAARKRVEWKRLLLLFLRIFALTLLALAFSRPFRHAGQPLWDEIAGKNFVFYLDDSAGMQYAEGGIRIWDQAKHKIRSEVMSAGRAQYSLYTFAESVRPVIVHERSRRKFLEKLDALLPTDAPSNFTQLSQSIRAACSEGRSARQCYVVSDFYGPKDMLESLKPARILPVRPAAFRNFYIKKFMLPPYPLVAGREENLLVFYGSTGMTRALAELTLWVDGEKAGSQTVNLRDSPEGVAAFPFTFSKAGPVKINIRSGSDGLSVDDDWEETVHVQNPLKALLIRARQVDHPFQSPDFYFLQALMSSESGSEEQSWIRFVHKGTADAEDEVLSEYDFVFLTDEADLSGEYLSRLRYFMKSGGSVVFLPSSGRIAASSATAAQINQFFSGRLQDAETVREKKKIFWGPVDYSETLFRAFDPRSQGGLEKVRVYRYMPYIEERGSTGNVLLWLNGTWPGLVERYVGSGRLFIWTVGLRPEWTDLPRDPLFVPLILEFVKYAGRVQPPLILYADAGATVELPVSAVSETKRLAVQAPGGTENFIYADRGGRFVLDHLLKAGSYSWEKEDRMHQVIVRVPQQESQPLQEADLEAYELQATAQSALAKSEAPRKVYFHAACFFGVLMLLILESLVAARLYPVQGASSS